MSGVWLIAPYALWMLLMTALPSTAAMYALRGLATLAMLALSLSQVPQLFPRVRVQGTRPATWLWGIGIGMAVFLVWIAQALVPGAFAGVDAAASPYAPAVCGWPLTVAKLLASALVISVAEEFFFRKWLVDFAGFGWMVSLFALNHWRWDLAWGGRLVFVAEGALAGLAYGLLARRFGIASAIVAHAVTNFLLGLFVIGAGQWQFW